MFYLKVVIIIIIIIIIISLFFHNEIESFSGTFIFKKRDPGFRQIQFGELVFEAILYRTENVVLLLLYVI